jgi:hypothetical protein
MRSCVRATPCRPCKAMARPVDKLALHYGKAMTFIKMFGNSNEQTKRMFKSRLKVR